MASRPNDARSARPSDAYRHAAAGLQFGATLAVFGGAGYALDRWLGTLPLFLLLGILLGFAGAALSLIRRLTPRTHAPPEEPASGDSARFSPSERPPSSRRP